MVDMFGLINELNTKLLGKDTFAYELYFVVEAFRLKLKLFSCHLNKNNFTHFTKLETTEPSVMTMKKYNNIIVSLDNEFGRCFADFPELS